MGPYGSQNYKTLLLLQIIPKFTQTSPECLSPVSSQTTQSYISDFFGNFDIFNFNDFFFVFP